ncbi:hypothetical protein C1752_02406 [Acaryochloris thomasi RCC1774]|uniref:Pyrroline-5-carboxylate reductase catalytic N-terminal domain-containing protein n=1 Tax=Acaryochloris thomasi RCC1774 TaxID=1764569 RepID=A0A2W1JII8_9CYAN|nr:NAD(P)-binding domain-containing protein [Acaryochloris thomasi]PZD73299.1 hypothetical protein C1752_02406 [Acaryochloris thomasi RCC1774]
MRIGIIGSGNIGGALGRLWAQAGHEVFFSSRNPETLSELVEKAGSNAQAGTAEDAIAFADIILEAIPFAATMSLSADALAGKTLITASNYYPKRDGDVEVSAPSQSEALAQKLPKTTLVKAFNMMFADEMEARANGQTEDELAIFYAGDNPEAKTTVAQLIKEAKFVPIDVGSLANGHYFQNGAPLYAERWSKKEAQEALAQVKE